MSLQHIVVCDNCGMNEKVEVDLQRGFGPEYPSETIEELPQSWRQMTGPSGEVLHFDDQFCANEGLRERSRVLFAPAASEEVQAAPAEETADVETEPSEAPKETAYPF